MAAIWDIRSYTAYRTDLAREMYAVAEMLAAAGDADWTNAEQTAASLNIIRAAAARLDDSSVGWLRAVVVTRLQDDAGPPVVEATNSEGRDCDDAVDGVDDPDTAWDETVAPWWRAGSTVANWPGRSGATKAPVRMSPLGCQPRVRRSPAPNKCCRTKAPTPDGTGPLLAPTHDQWVSRALGEDEWWVVVETCSPLRSRRRSQ